MTQNKAATAAANGNSGGGRQQRRWDKAWAKNDGGCENTRSVMILKLI
jgi:hypothetical protein